MDSRTIDSLPIVVSLRATRDMLVMTVSELRAENSKLRAALVVYANPQRWSARLNSTSGAWELRNISNVFGADEHDFKGWDLAQEALGGT